MTSKTTNRPIRTALAITANLIGVLFLASAFFSAIADGTDKMWLQIVAGAAFLAIAYFIRPKKVDSPPDEEDKENEVEQP